MSESASPGGRSKLELYFLRAISIVSLGIIASMAFSFPLGAAVFFSPNLGGSALTTTWEGMYINLLGVFFNIRFPSPVKVSDLFTLFWGLHASLFAIAMLYPKSLVRAILETKSHGLKSLLENTLTGVALVYPPLFLATSVVERILEISGVPVGELPFRDYRLDFLGLLQASIIEEVGFRMSIIGLWVAMVAYRLGAGALSLKAFWNPTTIINMLKLGRFKNRFSSIILFSAFIFGWAHVIYGSDVWKFGKVISATIAGIGLGYLYFNLGLPAAILTHWGFNYYYASYYFFDEIRGLPPPTEIEVLDANVFSYSQEFIALLIMSQTALVVGYLMIKMQAPGERREA